MSILNVGEAQVDTIKDRAGVISVLTSEIVALKARMDAIDNKQFATAWVTFNGLDGSIIASHNVTSVTKTSPSDYTVTFTNAMSNNSYAVCSPGGNNIGGGTAQVATIILMDKSYKTTTTCRFRVKNYADAYITTDRDSYDLVFFGGI